MRAIIRPHGQRVDTINSPQLKYRSRLLIADCANFCHLHFCKITRLFRFTRIINFYFRSF